MSGRQEKNKTEQNKKLEIRSNFPPDKEKFLDYSIRILSHSDSESCECLEDAVMLNHCCFMLGPRTFSQLCLLPFSASEWLSLTWHITFFHAAWCFTFWSLFLVETQLYFRVEHLSLQLCPLTPEFAFRPPSDSQGRWVMAVSSCLAQGYFSLLEVFDFL